MAARGLCAPAVPLSDEVTTDIEDMKAKLDSKVASAGYSPEALEAALSAGKVDISELNAAMANFSEPARKVRDAAASFSAHARRARRMLPCSFFFFPGASV